MASRTTSTPDALAKHWTHSLPAPMRPYAQLSRLDRPIGWQLLLLPCWMAIALVRTEDGFWPPDHIHALLFLIGAIAMRGAGCTWNDFVDRDIDARVERTRARPLPSGAVTPRAALVWLALQLLIGLLVLIALPRIAQIVALASLPFVIAYPFMKRVTWWPQAWLGLVFSWGALVGGAATARELAPEALLLYAGCFFWVMAYDTIYALQDVEDDALVGVRSTARLFGPQWREWTIGFYGAALFLWGAAAYVAGADWPTFAALGLIGGLLIWPEVQRPKLGDAPSALKAFKANALIGLAVLAAFALDPIWRVVRGYFGV
ncbi:MAG: 4-hydroxybenzoate octaprenyltransferase [Hyphomonadaceae bacterium]